MDWNEIARVAASWWLVWLVICFAAIAFWALRPKNRKRFDDDARIPFKDEEPRSDNRG